VEMSLVLKRPADTDEAKKAVAATAAIFMVETLLSRYLSECIWSSLFLVRGYSRSASRLNRFNKRTGDDDAAAQVSQQP
jgi:hypothetical protein